MRLRPLLAAQLLCCVLAAATPARAGDPAKAFADGVEMFEEKDYQAALPLFREAHAATDSPNARLYIARCLLEMGKVGEAYDEMKTTVAEASARAEKETKYAPTRDSAAAELALMEQKVGKLVVAITDAPQGISVNVNDAALGSAQLGRPVAMAPGKVTVVVSAPGKKTETRDVTLEAGQLSTVAVSLRDQDTGEAPVEEANQDEPVETSGGEARVVGFAVGALGLVGIGVGVGLAAKAKSDFDSIDSECGGATCPAEFQGRVDDGRSMQLGANIALIAGGALTAAGVAMVVFGGPSEVGAESAAITPLPGGGLVTIGGRF